MGTPYSRVYKRAITEFKDPALKSLLSKNSILFFEVMNNYLENAISLFTNPPSVAGKLKDATQPRLVEVQVEYNGFDTITLEEFPQDDILSEVIFECSSNDVPLNFEYNSNTHQIELIDKPSVGDIVNINWYFIGSFNSILNDEEEYILSQFIMACWSEYIFNDKLDIIRLLGDTDFKLTSNSTTTTSKTSWNIVNRETVTKRMNHYAWMQAFNKWGK